jgi:S-(hydroxymethyl)glutathione dehydrogenase/alcohol dehydrogenase
MRAAVLREHGGDLRVEDLQLPSVAAGQVRVRIAASGVCHSDLSVARGTIPATLPAVLGHEGAGVVVDVGDGVADVAPGDHVVLSWVVPCRACFFCLRGHPELCEHGMDHAFAGPYATATATGAGDPVFSTFGTATFGEETIVPARAAVPIDSSFPLDLAALVGCGVVTGIGAVVHSARVQPGESVAVVGCGGVGLAAVQGARLAGASPVIAIDRVTTKLALARRCGATETIDASKVDPVAAVRECTGGRGADHALEVVGTSATIMQAFAMARRAGTVTVVGAGAFDDMVSFGAMQLMVDAKTVRGCVYGSTDPDRDFPDMLRLHAAGAIDLSLLVTDHIALDDVDGALRAMERGETARSVIVF